MTPARAHLQDLAAFITASPSSFHAADESARRLTEAGFQRLEERDEWPRGPGRRFVVRDGAVIAWVHPRGADDVTPFRIVGAHTDSPGFKLKPKPTTSAYGWLQAGVEVYGGPLLNSWLDRELELAGRLVFHDGTTALVRTGPLLRFPQLAVHLDRAVNEDGLRLDKQVHLNPVVGVAETAARGAAEFTAGSDSARADSAGSDSAGSGSADSADSADSAGSDSAGSGYAGSGSAVADSARADSAGSGFAGSGSAVADSAGSGFAVADSAGSGFAVADSAVADSDSTAGVTAGPAFGGLGTTGSTDIVGHLAALAGRRGGEVSGYDIVTADTAPPAVFGLDDALFAAGRMDNLISVHAGLTAIVGATTDIGPITVFAAFDHEEVGSATTSGAQGPFLEHVLVRIKADATITSRLRSFADSWCLSADAGHAVHPNYPARHDPANRPVVNRGPLLKLNANQRYATDAVGAAEWVRACRSAGVPFQEFVSNNSVPCGSTIGPLTATRLGIRTIDVGVPLLSMHSARELCGVEDPHFLAEAIRAFLAPI